MNIETIKVLRGIESKKLCDCDMASLERPIRIIIKCRQCGYLIYDTEMQENDEE